MSRRNTLDDGVSRRNVLQSIGATGAAITATSGLSSSAFAFPGESTSENQSSRRTVTLQGTEGVAYQFSVTGLLNPVNDPDDVQREGGTVNGRLTGDVHKFAFTGSFLEFDANGDVEVYVDGEPFDPHSFPHRTLTIEPVGSVSYDVSASGAVEIDGTGTTPSPRRATDDSVNDLVRIQFQGELTYLDVEGEAQLAVDGDPIETTLSPPSIDPGRATIRSTGGHRSYRLQLGWDAAARKARESSIERGTINGTATETEDAYEYAGRFRYLTVPGIGTILNNPDEGAYECLSIGSDDARFVLTDQNGNTTSLELEPNYPEKIDLNTEIASVRVAASTASGDAVELTLSPGTTGEDVDRLRTLHFAAVLEREQLFEPLRAHAAQWGGRLRLDADGITAFYGHESGRPWEPSVGDPFLAAGFELTDLDDGVSREAILSKNEATGSLTRAQLSSRHRHNDGSRSVSVGSVAVEGSTRDDRLLKQTSRLATNQRVTIDATYTDDITSDDAALSATNGRTVLRSTTLELKYGAVEPNIPAFDPCDLPGADALRCDDVREGIESGASEIGKSASWVEDEISSRIGAASSTVEAAWEWDLQGGISASISAITAIPSWVGSSKSPAKWADQTTAVVNTGVFMGLSGLEIFAQEVAAQGGVNSCAMCMTTGRVFSDYSVSTIAAVACSPLGPVGSLSCTMFASALHSYLEDYTTAKAIKFACEEATLC